VKGRPYGEAEVAKIRGPSRDRWGLAWKLSLMDSLGFQHCPLVSSSGIRSLLSRCQELPEGVGSSRIKMPREWGC